MIIRETLKVYIIAHTFLIKTEMRGGIVREFGIKTYTLLYLKWITNKDLLYSTGNSAQYLFYNNLNGKRI